MPGFFLYGAALPLASVISGESPVVAANVYRHLWLRAMRIRKSRQGL
jgi:hypothetical protein